jgi:membrane peptidoglycan carboxypeptidase
VGSVTPPTDADFPETTTVYYSDGTTPIAKLGEVTRYPLTYAEMNDAVTESIVASEDKTFWTNEGVDFTGVLRAAWNNFTDSGGGQQGASTITQQYARVRFELSGATYSRKLREAVLAWKISDSLKKEQILEYYLNSVPFGRQTYGIEAAAQAFFGKTAKKSAPADQQITIAEAMVLVAMVKQPNPDPDNPKGAPGYDPTLSPEAEANARDRWTYVRGQLVEMGKLTPEAASKLVFPLEQVKKYDPKVGNGLEKPVGLVVNHVLSELTQSASSPFKGWKWKSIRDGGYKIVTTIDVGAQQAAENAADQYISGSAMFGQPDTLQAALVAVQPGTGRVLAYFGDHDGKGADYGGFYYDENGEATGVGRFPPGSSMKVYTLAAALKAGISLNSYWNWNEHDMPGRTGTAKIRNASTCTGLKKGDPTPCSLLNSTIQSLNVPFYELTVSVTPGKVLEMARDAGIDYMWTDDRVRQDLRTVKDMGQVVPSKFDTILGIGQYPVSVTDHANGIATFAAGGVRAQAHFVKEVWEGTTPVYGEKLPRSDAPKIMNQQAINDLTYALSKVGSAKINGFGWDTAGKTGTWEYNNSTNQNAHAWMVGFDKKIAAAVWVGNKDKEQAILDKGKATIWGSGIPTTIWKKFMTDATKAMNEKKENTKFNPPSNIGNENPDRSVPSPTPAQPDQGQGFQTGLPPTQGAGGVRGRDN